MNTRMKLSSFAGVLLAAVASLATSAPPHDWTFQDETRGVVELPADQDEVTFRFRGTAAGLTFRAGVSVELEPAPVLRSTLDETPVVVFVSPPCEVGQKAPCATEAVAMPSTNISTPYGWPGHGAAELPGDGKEHVFEVKLSREGTSHRPRAPRGVVRVIWEAHASESGFDDPPAGARVDLEAAP